MDSFSLDLAPALSQGFTYAAMLIAGFAALIALKFGFGIFRYIFRMIGEVLSGLGA